MAVKNVEPSPEDWDTEVSEACDYYLDWLGAIVRGEAERYQDDIGFCFAGLRQIFGGSVELEMLRSRFRSADDRTEAEPRSEALQAVWRDFCGFADRQIKIDNDAEDPDG